MGAAQGSPRTRVAIAAAAAALLTAIVVAVLAASGGGGSRPGVPALPERCLRAWNADSAATAYGVHNFDLHHYDAALVTLITARATEPGRDARGLCAVVFPSRALDPEPFAAGQVLRGPRWLPISSLADVGLDRVAELQAAAAEGPNATLDTNGRLAAL